MAIELNVVLSEDSLARLVDLLAQRLADTVGEPAVPRSPWMTISEAAEYLRHPSRQSIDNLLWQGKLARHKQGGRTLLARKDVEALVERDDERYAA